MDNDTQDTEATIYGIGMYYSTVSAARHILDNASKESDLTVEQVAKIRKGYINWYTRIEQKWLNSLGLNVQIPEQVRTAIICKTPLMYGSAEQLHKLLKAMRGFDELMKDEKM